MRDYKQHILFFILTVFVSTVLWANDNHHKAFAKSNEKAISYLPVDRAIDGPYVFHESEKTTVKYIVVKNNSLKVDEKSYPYGTVPSLSINIDKSKASGFAVRLRKKIASPPAIYPQPAKLFAISDIEGEFDAFVTTLQANKIIDSNYKWIYGNGHLVLNGDFFDRGINVTPCIWLVYKLEQEAEAAGGRVHFIVGNHEEMNMRGDLRYLKGKYKTVASKIGVPYIELYGENTELGKWLRSKNVIEKIGHTIFVHGGISPSLVKSGLSIKEINNLAHDGLGRPNDEMMAKGGNVAAVFHTTQGPMWYRGYFKDQLDESAITVILSKFNADHIVVGHTVVDEVCSYYNNKIIAIDVKHLAAIAGKKANALIIEKGKFYKTNHQGKRNPLEQGKAVIVGGKRPVQASNRPNSNSRTNLIQTQAVILQAVREGKTEQIAKHLAAGNDVNARFSTRKYSLLHYSIKNNQFDIAKLLLDKGAEREMLYNNQTPLMYAIKNQNAKLINLLIAKGAKINALNQNRESALFFVAKYGTLNNARLLMDKGANPSVKNKDNKTALIIALENENGAVANYLKSL